MSTSRYCEAGTVTVNSVGASTAPAGMRSVAPPTLTSPPRAPITRLALNDIVDGHESRPSDDAPLTATCESAGAPDDEGASGEASEHAASAATPRSAAQTRIARGRLERTKDFGMQ